MGVPVTFGDVEEAVSRFGQELEINSVSVDEVVFTPLEESKPDVQGVVSPVCALYPLVNTRNGEVIYNMALRSRT